jgi:predicted nucleic acid-binding protein
VSFILDTCVLSELVKPRPEPTVVEWIGAQDEHRLFLSVITFGELQKGIAKLPSGPKRDRLSLWVAEDLAARFRERILPIDIRVAATWGTMLGEAESQGKPIPVVDGLIGATARVHECVIVTRNVADLERTGVEVINPW